MSTGSYTLLGQAGWGSALVEAALTLADLPFAFEVVEPRGGAAEREKLLRYNPLGEVPTLILPDGKVMTESAAIMLHLADLAPGAGLVPLVPGERRSEFLRWLVFLVAAIYPTFTYGDVPSRYVSGKAAQDELQRLDRRREAPLLVAARGGDQPLALCSRRLHGPRHLHHRDGALAARPHLVQGTLPQAPCRRRSRPRPPQAPRGVAA